MDTTALDRLVEEGLEQLGFTDCFIVHTRIHLPKIEVFLDSDSYIDFNRCQKLSRWLEAHFDSTGDFGDNYILEVSSAGVGSPLRFLRQYIKNKGRLIDIKYGDNQRVKGTLADVEGEVILVQYEDKIKEGKKNKKVTVTERIPYSDIKEAKIKISFNG